MAYALNQGLARMANGGRLEGMGGLSQGVGLDLKPYLVGALASAPGRGRIGTESSGDVGLDLFYNLTPAPRSTIASRRKWYIRFGSDVMAEAEGQAFFGTHLSTPTRSS